MQKIQIERPGGYDRLRLVECPDPIPQANELVVATRAVGVNYADSVVRMGLYESAAKYVGWPITPGFEFAGVVTATGSAVVGVRAGDAVFGLTRFGGYASQVAVPATQIFALPAGMSFEEAGSMPTVFLTAWYALRELCRLRPGSRVLVHSASGGVGLAALQIARALGCEPWGLAGGEHKLALGLAYGAEVMLDKHQPDLWNELRRRVPQGFAAVLDPNGKSLRRSYAALGPMGRLITYGFGGMMPQGRGKPNWLKLLFELLRLPRFHPVRMTSDNKSVMAFNLSYLFEQQDLLREAMTEILGWFATGALRPLPVRSFPLADAASAQRELETGHTTGKLVLLPSQAPGAEPNQ